MKKSALKGKIFFNGQKSGSPKTVQKQVTPTKSWFNFFTPKKSAFKTKNSLGTTLRETETKYKYSGSKESLFAKKKTPTKVSETIGVDEETPNGVKVFKPNPAKLKKDNMLNGLTKASKEPKRGRYGLKTLQQIKQSSPGRFSPESLWLSLKGWAISVELGQRFNRIVATLLVVGAFVFLIYLSFFDRYFLVKDYEVRFADNSFLDSTSTKEVVSSFNNTMFLGIVPNNQFWFLNDQNLTTSARKQHQEVAAVRLIDRTWPNKATLEITTEPILVTLGINGDEYWRISQSGQVLSRDEANLRESLVVVLSPITLTYSSRTQGVNRLSNPTFADYSFEGRQAQKNRFWFIIWLWEQLKALKVDYVKTAIPSLSDFDTDVIITTSNNTELWFDLSSGDRDNIKKKIELAFGSSIADREIKGELKYIDFRTPKRLFVCPNGGKCAE